jgi:hypothetical protein
MTKTELKQAIKEIIQEELKGYSQYAPGGVTKGGTTDDFRQILTRIAKGSEKYKGDPERGNKILDKANPDNVARILRGEKPVYEGEGNTTEKIITKQELINHLNTLPQNSKVSIPRIYPGGFSETENESMVVAQAIEELKKIKSNNKFEKVSDTKFWLYQTPEEMKKIGKAVRGAGSLD